MATRSVAMLAAQAHVAQRREGAKRRPEPQARPHAAIESLLYS
jgi:hypothetical protein